MIVFVYAEKCTERKKGAKKRRATAQEMTMAKSKKCTKRNNKSRKKGKKKKLEIKWDNSKIVTIFARLSRIWIIQWDAKEYIYEINDTLCNKSHSGAPIWMLNIGIETLVPFAFAVCLALFSPLS